MFVCLFACSFILVRLFLDIEEYLRQLTPAETRRVRSRVCLLVFCLYIYCPHLLFNQCSPCCIKWTRSRSVTKASALDGDSVK